MGAVDKCQNPFVRSQGAADEEGPERPTRPVKAEWSPPSSPWTLKHQKAAVASKLSLRDGGLLIWEPVGLSPKDLGGTPFQLRVGVLPGQDQELVRLGPTQCFADTARPSVRRKMRIAGAPTLESRSPMLADLAAVRHLVAQPDLALASVPSGTTVVNLGRDYCSC